MARWDITHACGHATRYQLTGPLKDRERRAAQLEGRDCDACWSAKRVEASKAAGAAALDQLAARGVELPALIGSEKQVAWASQIRAKAVLALGSLREQDLPAGSSSVWGILLGVSRRGEVPAREAVVAALLDVVRTITNAGWWCDRGRLAPGEFVCPISWHAMTTASLQAPLATALAHAVVEYIERFGDSRAAMIRVTCHYVADAMLQWRPEWGPPYDRDREAARAFYMQFVGALEPLLDPETLAPLLPPTEARPA